MPTNAISFRFLLVAIFAIPAAARAQAGTGAQTSATVSTSQMTVACQDKVKAGSLSKVQTNLSYNVFKITLTLKNLCTGNFAAMPVSVPWKLTVGGIPMSAYSEGTATIPAGGTVEVSNFWTMQAGSFSFGGIVDPNNTLGESAAHRENNNPPTLQLTFTAAQVAAAVAATEAAAAAGSTTPSFSGVFPGGATSQGSGQSGGPPSNGSAAYSNLWNQMVSCGSDRVKLTDLAMSPSNPTKDQTVTVTATVTNMCVYTGSLPYNITLGNTVLTTGSLALNAGLSKTFTFNWVAQPGTHALNAEVDPANTFSEQSYARVNNRRASAITFTVGQ